MLWQEALPVDSADILEQSERNTMHRGVAPSLVEEPAGTIQMIEIILIGLTAPETQIRNLKVAPEMTS